MILSASRRTDIPAFYSEWFVNRLKEGFLLTVNPMNRKQVSRISLAPEVIDCIVFWTKNPSPLSAKLAQLSDYHYYFLFTLTPYPAQLEQGVPPIEKSVESFQELSTLIGPERVIWRYDPIIFSDTFSVGYHVEQFGRIAEQLESYTHKCVISFFDVYQKCKKNMRGISYQSPTIDQAKTIAGKLAEVAGNHRIQLDSCAQELDLDEFGIRRGKCIDDVLISKITGVEARVARDKNQRSTCRCVASIDIGAYNTCIHRCLYCYANFDHDRAEEHYRNHDPNSSLLSGRLLGDENITERTMVKLFDKTARKARQLNLF